ncbi:cell division protein FtsL [bacterium BMS3Abin02]|nr:cell division protein FtsL [bacterium BMS3Abin02]GBE21326.1 cell division protein FtsL [bacterium BMS3Bbin01]HDH24750.1 hypothetical protein [Actinomycetota bacterium]HDK45918.1 hypothetical protein [Actinomycetota bacterium]HDL49125.1 hypothetical protein [Actinomycetota bacterium]
MTARPARVVQVDRRLRVIAGRRSVRPRLGTWVLFTALAIALFFALILSRVALDKPALEMNDLSKQIEAEQVQYQQLRLEVARLQAPERIVPLAEELGLTYPDEVRVVVADGVGDRRPPTEDRFADVRSILTASP